MGALGNALGARRAASARSSTRAVRAAAAAAASAQETFNVAGRPAVPQLTPDRGRVATGTRRDGLGRPDGRAARRTARRARRSAPTCPRRRAPRGRRPRPGDRCHWEPVPGAIGYAVLPGRLAPTGRSSCRSTTAAATCSRCRTARTRTPPASRARYWYAVAALADRHRHRAAVRGRSRRRRGRRRSDAGGRRCASRARRQAPLHRPWRPMVGSEHLSHLLSEDTDRRPARSAPTCTPALRRTHDELGVAPVRAHAILCDDLGVYREVDGEPVHDFTRRRPGLRRGAGARPPAGRRARLHAPRPGPRPGRDGVRPTRAIISPPKDWDRWARPGPRPGRAPRRPLRPRRGPRALGLRGVERGEPVGVLVRHPRRVLAAVRGDRPRGQGRRPRLGVGGPASAAVGWVDEQLARRARTRRSTSCPPTSTAPRRWTCARSRGTGGRCRLVDRVGRHRRPTATRSTTPCSRRRSCCAACARRPGRIEALAPGWPRTTSRSSAGRRGCCTAGSGC